MKRVNLIVFTDNKTKKILEGIAFMTCPFCKKEILLDTDRIVFCDWKCRQENKFAYKLNKSNNPEGFDKVLYSKINNFNKTTLMEVFKNGKRNIL